MATLDFIKRASLPKTGTGLDIIFYLQKLLNLIVIPKMAVTKIILLLGLLAKTSLMLSNFLVLYSFKTPCTYF